MTETPAELRQQAAKRREIANHADGHAYHQQMQQADHLIAQAEQLEVQQGHVKPAKAKKEPYIVNQGQQRKKDLAKIHLFKKQAGLDDDTYRDMLEQLTGKRSAGKLSGPERFKVIKHLEKSTNKKKQGYPGQPNNLDSNAQLQKIQALLAEAKYPWSYATAIAKRQCGKEKLEFCDGGELKWVINALIANAEKHGRFLG